MSTIKSTPRFVLVAQGESNGPWDSDGFYTYFDFDQNTFVRDNWTTRFAYDGVQREHCRLSDLTDEERATVAKAMVEHAFHLLSGQTNRTISTEASWNQSFKDGIHVTVKGGRLFHGEGMLVAIETKKFYYNNWHSNSTTFAKIRTSDGRVERANVKYITIDITDDMIRQAAERFAQEIIEEDGFNSNIVRYSRRHGVVDFVLSLFIA